MGLEWSCPRDCLHLLYSCSTLTALKFHTCFGHRLQNKYSDQIFKYTWYSTDYNKVWPIIHFFKKITETRNKKKTPLEQKQNKKISFQLLLSGCLVLVIALAIPAGTALQFTANLHSLQPTNGFTICPAYKESPSTCILQHLSFITMHEAPRTKPRVTGK